MSRVIGAPKKRREWKGLLAAILLGAGLLAAPRARAADDSDLGARAFRVCSACHSLRPDLNMTGPSLATVWGRNAGSLKSFDRYSAALKASGVTWNAVTLDAWLTSPAKFIPGNAMTFAGIADAQVRTALLDFLHAVGAAQSGGPSVAARR
jgi:cytochrome c